MGQKKIPQISAARGYGSTFWQSSMNGTQLPHDYSVISHFNYGQFITLFSASRLVVLFPQNLGLKLAHYGCHCHSLPHHLLDSSPTANSLLLYIYFSSISEELRVSPIKLFVVDNVISHRQVYGQADISLILHPQFNNYGYAWEHSHTFLYQGLKVQPAIYKKL